MNGRIKRFQRSGCRVSGVLLAFFLSGVIDPVPSLGQTLMGNLIDARSGQAIMLGYVALLAEEGDRVVWTLADKEGFFRLEAPEPGSYMLYGESLGYYSGVEGPVALEEDQVVPAEFRLAPMPVVLDSLRVEAKSRRMFLVLAGFYDRQERGPGHFIGPDEIRKKTEARRVTDFFWAVPGINLVPRSNLAGSGYVPMMRASAGSRGFCLPEVYLDGIPMPGADEIDEIIDPMDIEAMEVYRSASEVPARFTTGASNCGVILIWARRGR